MSFRLAESCRSPSCFADDDLILLIQFLCRGRIGYRCSELMRSRGLTTRDDLQLLLSPVPHHGELALNTAGTASETTLKIPGFELLRQLGAGGMGTVYLARQESLNRHVAIKILDQVDDPSALRRFERETLLAASVKHPHIVFIVDSGTIDGVPYLVQELVDGRSLAELLADRRLSAQEVCDILTPVVDALAELHQAGILHRDLKPRNILIDSHGRPMLSDFGLAVCIESGSTLTHSEMVIGTLDYMAPEQRHRLDVDERADQYSLAAVAYEMLTGDKPLGAFKQPSELNSQLPVSVDSVLLRALSRDPDDRFTSIRELFDALTNSLLPPDRKLLKAVSATAVITALLTFAVSTYEPPHQITIDASAFFSVDQQSIESVPVSTHPIPASTDVPASTNALDLGAMTVAELRDFARDEGLTGYSGLARSELEKLILSGGHNVELPPGWTSEFRIDRAGRRYRWYISPEGKSYRSPPDTKKSPSGVLGESPRPSSTNNNL